MKLAAREYPDLDVTVRGAISIAHRLQDPLAELVKLDPKSIGVGQYQHDVDQTRLRQCLDREVESCVNAVGVDVNLASAPLLSHVAGIGPKLAQRVVEYRDAHGRFESRGQLLEVPKLGPKAYEQAAGFLRIRDGQQPLDNSAVHPESYYVVERMAARLNVPARQLVGNAGLAGTLNAHDFVDDQVGLPTIQDILAELAKPGRDPRSEFQAVKFTEGVQELEDLREGMILEGVVTNVTRFGAFVDIGVHQDGLIHISQLANAFVQDPSDVVSVGDVVRVKVLEVDLDRRRIALSRKQVAAPRSVSSRTTASGRPAAKAWVVSRTAASRRWPAETGGAAAHASRPQLFGLEDAGRAEGRGRGRSKFNRQRSDASPSGVPGRLRRLCGRDCHGDRRRIFRPGVPPGCAG